MMTPLGSKSLYLFLLFVCLWLGTNSILFAQTKGLIVKAASGAGATVLDPNQDGYVSKTTAGFTANDVAESEIPFTKIDLPIDDPVADVRTGPTDGFTDFVGNGDIYSAASYYDGTNLLFRFRLGGFASNAKGYSVLIDTDGKFGNTGPNADPQYSTSNPGFEIEVVMRTNFAVEVNNVNSASSVVLSSTFIYDNHSQKSVAFTTNNGDADFFYDFFVPFSALQTLGVTTSTPLRMVPNTVINPKSALVGNISDIGGVNDATTGTTNGWINIINGQTPSSPDGTSVQSDAPVVISPILAGASSITGTSTEPNGTTILVYKNGVFLGSTTVSGGNWTLSSVVGLTAGDVIRATAQNTNPNPDETTSDFSNSVTVTSSCTGTSVTPTAISICSGTKGVSVTGTSSGTVNFYKADADSNPFLIADNVPVSSAYIWNPNTATVNSTCNEGAGNTLTNGTYFAEQIETGKCASAIVSICNGSASTATVDVTSASVVTGVIGGTGTANAWVYIFVNNIYRGVTQISAGGVLSFTTDLTVGGTITARVTGSATQCWNATAETFAIPQTATPVVNSPITTASTSISGTSSEANGTVITIFKNGTSIGTATVSGGTWTLTGVSGLIVGDAITATALATGETQSTVSSTVTVTAITQTPVTPTITGAPYFEGGTSVSGGFSAGTVNAGDVLRVYIDGVQLNDSNGDPISVTLTTNGQTSWTLTGIGGTELYPGGVLTARVTRTGNSEGASSNSVTVQCSNPDLTTESLSATTPSVCNNTTATVQVANTDSGVIYALYDATNTTALSSDRLGTGGTITFSTFNLTSDVSSFRLRAFKIPNTTCTDNATKTLPTQITIYTNPLDRTLSPTSQTVSIGNAGSITVATSESGVNYQLWKDLTTDILVSSQTGNGGTLTFSTGALGVATTFYIKAIRTHIVPEPDLFCELVMTQNAVVNVNNDADGDGIVGTADLDDDNDGIPDIVEGKGTNPSLDTDGNGIPNFLDSGFAGFTDTNNDGVDDRFDQDLDGIANHLDLDSDNDGIADVIEAGGVDVAGNGIVDFTQADANAADVDNDGLIDNIDQNPAAVSADAAASSELTNGSYGGKYVNGSALDTDADGIPDFLDLDTDNDGIMDVLEAGGIDTNNDGIIDFIGTFASNDSNSNGWINTKDGASGGISPITTTGTAGSAPTGYLGQNADGDSVPNFRDLDSDNDGINDVIEAGLTDSDNNGLIGSGSGTTITGLNTTSGVVTGATSTVLNTGGDSVANYLDLDSDNDGINDVRENVSAAFDTNNDGKIDAGDAQTDADGDGIFTGLDTSVGFGDSSDPAAADADLDGVPNYRDLDADNDGINDVIEGGNASFDTNNDGIIDGTDADSDGTRDNVDANDAGFGEGTNGDITPPLNSDGDSIPNYLDLDSDNDGINDVRENGSAAFDTNNDGKIDSGDGQTDTDGDGIFTGLDTSAGFGDSSDPAAADADNDGVPNYRDLDADNDGINDVRENGNGALDTNSDGKIDSGDGQTDTDNDGVFTGLDNFIGFGDATDPAPANADGDLVANYLDLDSDNDGINDVIESGNAGFDTNSDGVIDGPDADLDGIQDGVDANDAGFGEGINGDATPPLNSDSDSIPNYLDLDSDNDNINDIVENQDTNGNGIIDGGETSLDANNDGLVDSADNDGDGIQDAADTNDSGFGENAGTSTATDTDGGTSPNYIDLNSDGDTINDIDEVCGSAGCSTLDGDNDGDVDGSADNDGDGILDAADANDNGFGEGAGALPVTFVAFEGKLINNKVQFTWKTASETNNSHFIIERSLDTQLWAEVSQVNAKGESQGLTVYQGFDENPQVGTNYYRLWQVDKDGQREAFPRLIDITYQFMAITSVYPNPSIDKLNVKLKSNVNEPVQIRIINASGKVLQTTRFQKATLEEEAVLNVKDLPNGTYFLEVFYHRGRETLKFIK
jgi:hypothetical protein